MACSKQFELSLQVFVLLQAAKIWIQQKTFGTDPKAAQFITDVFLLLKSHPTTFKLEIIVLMKLSSCWTTVQMKYHRCRLVYKGPNKEIDKANKCYMLF